jgi:hypothetical protein
MTVAGDELVAGCNGRWQACVRGAARRGSGLVVAVVIATLGAACTSGGAPTGAGKSGQRVTSGPAPTRSAGQPAGAGGGSVLPCSTGTRVSDATVAPFRVVLGVVALPVSPGYPALQTSLANGPRRLFAKNGLFIRPGTTFELIVPARLTGRLSIGWETPSRRVVVSGCASPRGGGWLAFVGGYWIDHPACVRVIVRSGGRQQQVPIGLGKACPGQRPPQGPSQS